MNIKKELIKTFKNLLSVHFEKVYSPSELKVSEKAVGAKVEMINADGSLSPVADGDYVMEDGFSFSVKDGVITSIEGEQPQEPKAETVEAAKEETPSEEATETPEQEAQDETKVDERITALETKVNELVDMINKLTESTQMEKQNATEAVNNFSKIVAELNDNIETLAKVPVQLSKTSNNPSIEDERFEAMKDLARILGKK